MNRYRDLLAQLKAQTLDPDGFSHRDHVGVAYEALKQHDFFTACKTYADGLIALTKAAGVPEKYNATVTLAFMSLIAERMQGTDGDADAFINANPDFLDKNFLRRKYPAARLSSPLARKVGLLPL